MRHPAERRKETAISYVITDGSIREKSPAVYIRGDGRKEVELGKMQRDKGQRFERYVAGLFKDWGYPAFRTGQFSGKTGGCADVEGVPYIHIECKHCERMTLYDWMAQAIRDSKASKEKKPPVVIHKANNKPVLVTMLWEDWIELYKEWEAGQDV